MQTMSRALEADLSVLREYLSHYSELPEPELLEFAAHVSRQHYQRGEFFTRIGDTHDRVGFVVHGLFRVYYIGPEGEYHIRNFCQEGRPLGSYATLLTGQAAHVNIEALEDSWVLQFSFTRLEAWFARSAAWERLGRRIAEQHYISRERREYSLLAFDARGRVDRFHEDFPGLEPRLTRTDIASYIGVRPETLSRLLGKKRRT
jgi:CRP-like cAMP-binding protein